MSGLTATQGTRRDASASRIARDGENGADRDVRVARREEHEVGGGDRLEHTGRRRGLAVALDANCVDLVAVAARDEPLLERELPGRRGDPRAHAVVGGRQELRLDAEGTRKSRGHARERLALSKQLRADEMDAEVEVAEGEPRLPAERRDAPEHAPRLSRASPAALVVVDACERVHDRVEVGRDVQAEDLDVVADVADDGDVVRRCDVHDSADEACAADAAGEDGHSHGVVSESTACVRGPQRSCSRSRSASVSTSSARFGTSAVTVSTGSPRKRFALSRP